MAKDRHNYTEDPVSTADELQSNGTEERLPPRIMRHAGKKSKRAKIYSIVLFWLFFLLTVALIVWGYKLSDPS